MSHRAARANGIATGSSLPVFSMSSRSQLDQNQAATRVNTGQESRQAKGCRKQMNFQRLGLFHYECSTSQRETSYFGSLMVATTISIGMKYISYR
jgi:hypothetical protein